jgi:hypothetical protein
MPILNYTTTIAPAKTVGEIQAMLAKAGATRILTEYEQGAPAAISFELKPYQYRLPCRFEGIARVIYRDRDIPPRLRTAEQAQRVAWRIIKDWIEAQLAIIQSQMVTPDEVFLPYRLNVDGETLYQVITREDRLIEQKGVSN